MWRSLCGIESETAAVDSRWPVCARSDSRILGEPEEPGQCSDLYGRCRTLELAGARTDRAASGKHTSLIPEFKAGVRVLIFRCAPETIGRVRLHADQPGYSVTLTGGIVYGELPIKRGRFPGMSSAQELLVGDLQDVYD